jgi:hypothetical protein
MLAKFLENELPMDGSPECQCGKGTLDCSIHPNTRGEWIASMQDSLAKILVSLESRPDLEKALGQGFTEKSCESLAWYDQDTSSWKTYQRSFLTDWESYSETWPRWGITVNGSALRHPMWAHRMGATDGLHLPNGKDFHHTPNTTGMDVGSNSRRALKARLNWPSPNTSPTRPQEGNVRMLRAKVLAGEMTEAEAAAMLNGKSPFQAQGKIQQWPTPTAHNAKETNAPSESNRNTPTLAAEVGGKLNPSWVAWLMGFPIEWVNSKG